MKIMSSPMPSVGLKLLEQTGLMALLLPEVMDCRGCIQKDDRGYHQFDVMDHNIYACDGAPIEKPFIRLAAFLHDVGKPAAKIQRTIEGLVINNFYNHEFYSSEITKKLMTRMKFSNAEISYVTHLIQNHMFHYESNWTDSAVRRFIIKIGKENLNDLIDLRLADMYGKYNQPVRLHDSQACKLLIELKDRVSALLEQDNALSLKDLKINGNDLILLGVKGRQIGIILNDLFQTVIDDPKMNTKEKLLEISKNLIEKIK
jgi:tRNA nucleotidyltransferase/poly(A) polymerase